MAYFCVDWIIIALQRMSIVPSDQTKQLLSMNLI